MAAGSASAGSGPPVPGPGAVLIGDRLYSGVLITLENCLLPEHTLRFTPSMSSGLDSDTETELRVTGCELIQAAGILLRLPQVAMATGQVLFQRFFYTKSFVKHSMEPVSMACVHLASKIEEAPRRIRDVINVFHRLRHLREKKKPVPLILDQEYVNLKNQIIKAERRVLKELGFCVHVKHPHKIIVMYLQVLECERNQHLVQTSWNYMNDSLRTDVFVRFQPESIACACIYLAARTLEIPLPNRPHWFLLFGATEEEIQEICLKILQLYTRKKVDLSDLESKIEKKKLAIEEAKAQAKGLVPEGAPGLDNTAGFSPIPKNESPKEAKGNKPSPLPVQAMKNAKRKTEGAKRMSSNSPVNGVQKGRESRSRSGSRDQSYSRSPSRSVSPKHRKSESYSTSSGSKSHSRSRSRSDSPPRQFNHSSSYKGSKELQQLSKQYSNIKLLQLDVVCENSIKKVVKEVEEIVGDKGLNCLINNAGINVLASLEEVTAETMLTIYETNTVAQLMVTKAFLPLLRKAAQLSTGMGCHRAAIINMSSLAASMQLVQANEMFLKVYPYRIAKTALNMITRCLAADLKSDGILCISLHPGWLQTDMGGNMAPMQVQEAIPGILSVLDRLGEKENGSFLDWQGETLPW